MRKSCLIVSVTALAVGPSLGNPVVVDYDRMIRGIHSSSSTQGSTLSTSSSSLGQPSAYSDSRSISYGSHSGGLVHDGGIRTIGINAFGGTDSSYGTGNRFLPTSGSHIVGEQDNKVSKRTVKCPTCGGEGILRNWWGGRETCENCKGEGLSVQCSNCDSTGRIWRWWAGKTDCPECRGKKGGDGK